MNFEQTAYQEGKLESHPRKSSWLGALFLGILLGLLGVSLRSELGLSASNTAVEMAPDFEIPLFGQEASIKLSQFQGQGVVVNFWASWCYPCREEMALLESSWQNNGDKGVVFVGVNVWDKEAEAVQFLNKSGVTYFNGPDVDEKAIGSYTLQGVPTTLFISPDGSLNQVIYGMLTPDSLSKAVEAIIP
jgi:thiol-disulfide isomerase/thioredoxin